MNRPAADLWLCCPLTHVFQFMLVVLRVERAWRRA